MQFEELTVCLHLVNSNYREDLVEGTEHLFGLWGYLDYRDSDNRK